MKKRYITSGIRSQIPGWMQNLIWFLWESEEIPKRDYFQTCLISGGNGIQRIALSQEHPPYSKTVEIHVEEKMIDVKILIIEDDENVTMLLSSEA